MPLQRVISHYITSYLAMGIQELRRVLRKPTLLAPFQRQRMEEAGRRIDYDQDIGKMLLH
jgi:hypothetical protein